MTTTKRTLGLSAALVLMAGALAGCAADDGDDNGAGDGAPPSYVVMASNVPATVTGGEPFTFTVSVAGATQMNTDHVGAHYGTASADTATTAVYPNACPHKTGSLPGSFEVTCTIAAAGTFFLRGHARVTHEGEELNFWSDEKEITVEAAAPEYTLTAQGFPSAVVVTQPFEFDVVVEGPEGTTDHVAAHFSRNSTDEPTLAAYPTACSVKNGSLPATFTVSCTAQELGTWFIRGHMMLPVGGSVQHYWTDEIQFEAVAPEYTLTAPGAPAQVTVNQNFTFMLNISGPAGFESDHIGAHFGTGTQTEPSTTAYPQACKHAEGALPGEYEVTCKFTENRTYYLRGHMRLTFGGQQVNYWTGEIVIAAAGSGYGP